MPKKNLHRQVKGMLEDKSDKLNLISGSLGITIDGKKTVEVSNREGYVWVRLRGSQSELIQAYNASVSPIFDLPVLVVRQGNKYAIYGRDIQRYDNWGITPYLPKHGTQHSFSPENGMGGDVTWIYSRQFVPMLASPSGTSGAGLLNINSSVYRTPEGIWEFIGNISTPNILPAKPTDSQARMMLLYWDLDTDNAAMLTGTAFSATLTGTSSILPYVPTISDSRKIPLAGIRLVSGTSVIGWDNIYDLRQFAINVPPGFNGGFGVMEEGIIQGTGTILNFIGAGVTASISGSIARIVVTATGDGGESLWTTGSVGNFSITTKDGSNDSRADKALSHGINNRADGANSHAEGSGTLSTGSASHSEGSSTIARGVGSHAEGNNTLALGVHSHAEGINTIASGSYSHAEGEDNIALGWASHVAGGFNEARGLYSAIIAGNLNAVYGQNSAILSGDGITGSANNTAYTDLFNIKRLNTGTAVSNVGINAQGFLVTGTTGGGDTLWVPGSAGVESVKLDGGGGDAKGDYSLSAGRLNNVGGFASSALGGDSNTVSGTYSSIVSGYLNQTRGDASAVLAGQANTVLGTNSSIVAGNGITGSADNTAYTDYLNIRKLNSGASINNIGIASDGSLVTGSAGGATDGWNPANGTWSFLSADSPSFVVSVNSNITGSVGLGDKIKLSHLGNTKHFIITAESVTGSSTYLNLYGGTDYTLTTGSITSPNYSHEKSPYGFPTSPAKWSATVTDTANNSQAAPVAGTYYNLGNVQIAVPIGVWRLGFQVVAWDDVTNLQCSMRSALSTSASSLSDATFQDFFVGYGTAVVSNNLKKTKVVTVLTKTTFFLITTTGTTGVTTLRNRGDVITTELLAECAYL